MSTLRQKESNRRNSQKSTGPTSVTGKAASSMNALKTGIHAKSHIIPTEKRADLEQLTEEYYQRFQPASPEVRCLVDDLIRCEWTLRRLDFAEAQAWEYQNHDIYRDPEPFPLGKSVSVNHNSYSKLQYRLDATRRAYHRALQALKQLQAEAAAAPAHPSRRTRGSPVRNHLTRNNFPPNWLRSVNPLHRPTPARSRTSEPRPRPPGTRTSPEAPRMRPDPQWAILFGLVPQAFRGVEKRPENVETPQ
jgi:hypothetical protein